MKWSFCFLMMLVISVDAAAITCSKAPLTVWYVNGAVESSLRAMSEANKLVRFMQQEGSSLDVKGISTIGVIPTSLSINYKIYEHLKDALIGSGTPLQRIAAQVTMYLSQSVHAFLQTYGQEDLDSLDTAMENFAKESGFDGYRESSDRLFFHLKTQMDQENKTLVISKNISSWIAQSAILRSASILGTKKAKFITSFMVSPPRDLIRRADLSAFSYISVFEDPYQAFQQVIPFPSRLGPNIKMAPNRISTIFGSFRDTYLSLEKATRPGVNKPPQPMIQHFKDLLLEGLSMMPSNDSTCCGSTGGRVWINKVNCIGGDTCIGGIVSDKISLNIHEDSYIDPEAKVCLISNTENNPTVSGLVNIWGKLGMGPGTKIVGGVDSRSAVSVGSHDGTVLLQGSSEIRQSGRKSLSIKGSVAVSNSSITGSGTIEGIEEQVGNDRYISSIHLSKVSGDNINLRGAYLIGTPNLKDPDINGLLAGYPGPTYSWWESIYLSPSSIIGENVSIEGVATIRGTVKNYVEIRSFKIADGIPEIRHLIEIDTDVVVEGPRTKIQGKATISGPSRISAGSEILGTRYSQLGGTVSLWTVMYNVTMSESRIQGSAIVNNSTFTNNSVVHGCLVRIGDASLDNTQSYGGSWDYLNGGTFVNQIFEGDVEYGCVGGSDGKAQRENGAISSQHERDYYQEIRNSFPLPDDCTVFGCGIVGTKSATEVRELTAVAERID